MSSLQQAPCLRGTQLRELMNRTGLPGAGATPEAAVSSYLTVSAPLGARANFGTWDSLVHSLASVSELRCTQSFHSALRCARSNPNIDVY